jgi:YbbR domain-containing protein
MKNKALTALLSVGIALALWLYVVTFVSPNSDKKYTNIPVSLQGEVVLQERGLMITTTELPMVSLHLEGNRTDLNKLNSSNITIAVDVSKIGEPGVHHLSYSPSYPGDVPNNAITVLSRTPSNITLTVEKRISKQVPVEVNYTGSLSEDFMADKENKELDYEVVNVVGPQSVIDQIAMARIDVNMDGRAESISEQFQYTLCNEKGEPVDAQHVTTDVESIALTMRIVRVKEIQLLVNVVAGGGATPETSSIKVEPENIRVSGSDNLLADLETLVLGTINLGEMPADAVLSFPIKLPDGITNETGVLEATVDVQFPELGTKTLVVRNFTPVNVPAGLDANVITKQLEITVRGPKSAVDAVTPDNVQVTVDFADEQVGTATVKADISVNVGGVGAVGAYNITATLRKAG